MTLSRFKDVYRIYRAEFLSIP